MLHEYVCRYEASRGAGESIPAHSALERLAMGLLQPVSEVIVQVAILFKEQPEAPGHTVT